MKVYNDDGSVGVPADAAFVLTGVAWSDGNGHSGSGVGVGGRGAGLADRTESLHVLVMRLCSLWMDDIEMAAEASGSDALGLRGEVARALISGIESLRDGDLKFDVETGELLRRVDGGEDAGDLEGAV